MFKRLHIRLTLLCTFVSGMILILMSFICLSFSENRSRESHFSDFKINISMLVSHMESQSVISNDWLNQFRIDTGTRLDILDNGSKLIFHMLPPPSSSPAEDAIFAQARQYASEHYMVQAKYVSSSSVLSTHVEFPLSCERKDYYASVCTIPKNGSVLDIAVLLPLVDLEASILWQRFLFAGADILGIILLAVFFWFFTWRMILPLIESRRKQTEFIASASHELRSPLTVMLSSLSAMNGASPEDAAHFSETIAREGKRMSRLIDDMLTLSGADSSHFAIHKTSVEMDTLLLSAYEKFESLAKKQRISLKITLPDEPVPPCPCDRERIEQVLSILLDNALSYTPAKGTVRLSLQVISDKLILQVADNGAGVPDSEKKAVFDRFYRCDKSHKDKNHFGLGLCIAQEIVRLHKGQICLEDTPGGGATFRVILNLTASKVPEFPLS